MPSTFLAGTFRSWEYEFKVGVEVDGVGVDGFGEARPAGTGIEFVGGGEEGGSASGALEGSRGFDGVEVGGVGGFGSFEAEDAVLFGG